MAQQQQAFFRHGHADRPGTEDGGSRLFMLNVHMWQYGRPQPRTLSVQERRDSTRQSKQGAGQKRARRKDYLKDMSVRRRAAM
jgi:hypothetical protein